MGKAIDRMKEEREGLADAQMKAALTEVKRSEHNEVLSTLDMLRRKRKAGGGTGAPLAVPVHLRDAAAGVGIVITDRDFDQQQEPTTEEEDDTNSDVARRINEAERDSK